MPYDHDFETRMHYREVEEQARKQNALLRDQADQLKERNQLERERNRLERERNLQLELEAEENTQAQIRLANKQEELRHQQERANLLKEYELGLISSDQYADRAFEAQSISAAEWISLKIKCGSMDASGKLKAELKYGIVSKREYLDQAIKINLISMREFFDHEFEWGLVDAEKYLSNLYDKKHISAKELLDKSLELNIIKPKEYVEKLLAAGFIRQNEMLGKQLDLGVIDERSFLKQSYERKELSGEEFYKRSIKMEVQDFEANFKLSKKELTEPWVRKEFDRHFEIIDLVNEGIKLGFVKEVNREKLSHHFSRIREKIEKAEEWKANKDREELEKKNLEKKNRTRKILIKVLSIVAAAWICLSAFNSYKNEKKLERLQKENMDRLTERADAAIRNSRIFEEIGSGLGSIRPSETMFRVGSTAPYRRFQKQITLTSDKPFSILSAKITGARRDGPKMSLDFEPASDDGNVWRVQLSGYPSGYLGALSGLAIIETDLPDESQLKFRIAGKVRELDK